jgi:TatD DNase family protein
MHLIDTHAHVDEIEDIEGALVRAEQSGVRAVVGVGSGLESNRKILNLADRHPKLILPALGLHPWRLEREDLKASIAFLEEHLARSLGLGEAGLDFAVPTPQTKQTEVFRRLLSLAAREGKPVLLHARRAWAEALEQLGEFKIQKAVFHWYSGPPEILKRILDRGYFISATPAAEYSDRHREALRAAPLGQILLETDAPEKYRGRASEPCDLTRSLLAVSGVKGVPPEEVAAQAWENSLDFFGFAQEPAAGDFGGADLRLE